MLVVSSLQAYNTAVGRFQNLASALRQRYRELEAIEEIRQALDILAGNARTPARLRASRQFDQIAGSVERSRKRGSRKKAKP
jgi:hypothetical protein